MWGFGALLAPQAVGQEVPFGDKVSPVITKYNRLRPNIATAGPLKEGAISELKSLGFATVLDLRGPDEGTDVEKRAVETAGLRYLNIPVTVMVPFGRGGGPVRPHRRGCRIFSADHSLRDG